MRDGDQPGAVRRVATGRGLDVERVQFFRCPAAFIEPRPVPGLDLPFLHPHGVGVVPDRGAEVLALMERNPKGGMAIPSPSLGLIKPTKVTVTVTDGEPWDAAAQAKIDKASAPDLFGTSLRPLQPAPFAVTYHYHCESAGCSSHHQKVLDWEAGEGGRKWLNEYGTGARDAMLKKWRDEMLSINNDVHFYVGNQNARRRSFSVLGVWYPKFENALF